MPDSDSDCDGKAEGVSFIDSYYTGCGISDKVDKLSLKRLLEDVASLGDSYPVSSSAMSL